ncbi:hypothetical protein HYZ97_00270 [Candidatus Pacearchaeota archaeon]|nr:hypothetical protein [Candidatus Pacearchaeota archaeon]
MEEAKKEEEPALVLESGSYEITGPSTGEIQMDTLILKSGSGATRIWKLKSLDKKQALFEIVKFG